MPGATQTEEQIPVTVKVEHDIIKRGAGIHTYL